MPSTARLKEIALQPNYNMSCMFFRHAKQRVPSFEDRLSSLSQHGFTTARDAGGLATVTRKDCGALVEDQGDGKVGLRKAGVLVDGEIATLIHGGFQMFLRAPSGKDVPALASHLKALHAFDEDLREGLGLTSLYNLSLGTTFDSHLYDRVEDRDQGPHTQPWEK